MYSVTNYIQLEFSRIILAIFILIFSTIILPVVPVIYLLQKLVNFLATVFRPEFANMLTGVSGIMSLDKIYKRPKFNLVHFSVYSEKLDLQNMRKIFKENVINKINPKTGQSVYQEFTQFPVSFLDYPFWEIDTKFDISKHIRLYDYENDLALPSPCDVNDLSRVMGGLLAKPWTRGQSPWEILLVNNFVSSEDTPVNLDKPIPGDGVKGHSSGQGQCVHILRWNHVLGDGFSFLKLTLRELSDDAPPSPPPPVVGKELNTKTKLPSKNIFEKFQANILVPLRLPYDFADMIIESMDGLNAWHLMNQTLSRKYFTSISGPILVDFVKEIKNLHKVSYMSVIMAALAGGIERVMLEAGQDVPNNLTVGSVFPMAGHPDEGLVNHMTIIFSKLPVKSPIVAVTEPETCKKQKGGKLRQISNGLKKSKHYAGPLASFYLLQAFGASPNILKTLIHDQQQNTLLLSSFPASEKPVRIYGCTCTEVFFGVGLNAGNMGASVTLLSWAGRQRFVVNIDQNLFPSQELFSKLGVFIQEELHELYQSGLAIKNN